MVARMKEFFKKHRFLAHCVEILILFALVLVVASVVTDGYDPKPMFRLIEQKH